MPFSSNFYFNGSTMDKAEEFYNRILLRENVTKQKGDRIMVDNNNNLPFNGRIKRYSGTLYNYLICYSI